MGIIPRFRIIPRIRIVPRIRIIPRVPRRIAAERGTADVAVTRPETIGPSRWRCSPQRGYSSSPSSPTM
jgi:hypothetical protein